MDDELWPKARKSFQQGDFTYLEELLGGPEGFDRQVIEWYEAGAFEHEPAVLAEALTCACFLGRTDLARLLLDKGVDPAVGTATGMSAFHWAADRGQLETVRLLVERGAPLEQKNMYGGTVLSGTFWSITNGQRPQHAEIIEALLDAGAVIEPGTLEWWEKQHGIDAEAMSRVRDALIRRNAS